MNRFAASLLVVGLTASGAASAQSGGYYGPSGYGQPSSQQGYNQPGYSSYPQPTVDRYGQSAGGQYDYARVVRVDPVIQGGYAGNGYAQGNQGYVGNAGQRCYQRNDGYVGGDGYGGDSVYRGNDGYRDNQYGNQSGGSQLGRTMATVIGGVIGAAVGSQTGGGSARYATSALGSMVGGMAGREVYEASQRNRYPRTGTVTVCDPLPQGNGAYYPAGNQGVSAYDVTYEYAGRRYVTRTNYHPGDRIRVRVDVRPE